MFAKRNFSAYFLVHLTAGLLIAVIVAFNMLHGYSTRFEYLSDSEAVWRTFTYVLPKWTFFIALGGGIVTIMALGAHKFLANLSQCFRAYRKVNGLRMVLGLVMALLPIQFFLSTLTDVFVPLILGLVALEVSIIHLVQWLWSKAHPQPESRNEAVENNWGIGRNILIANLLGAVALTGIMLLPYGQMPYTPFYLHFLLALNALLLWALQSACFMVLHGCQKSSRELVQGLILSAGIIVLASILSYGLLYYWYWILAFMASLLLYSFGLVAFQVRRGYFGLEKAKRAPLAAY